MANLDKPARSVLNTIPAPTWARYKAEATRYVKGGVTVRRVLRDAHVRHAAAQGWN
jgi:hypothetical protein